ncbi:hypothetical protein [Ligilactobacillus equi]|uniref:Uncharacterized protein n=1 Tax=Ligilactobacillus equi DPC 6820 TaxID=1392007 RepID=V7HWP0_9LACO|nr:hypothetical protein [Ligilactobacillus equi]ETA73431.1 hypothetical protein LEQ_0152c [Ligilactobacillus equi DPC 6820]MCQ2556987.1 hypothetical protein [Ligilactobacillus sp.]
MLKVHTITDSNFLPTIETYLNLNYGNSPDQILHLQTLTTNQKKHQPFILLVRSCNQEAWPFDAFNSLVQAGYALAYLEVSEHDLQANYKIKTATRWLLLHAYQYGLDPFRYLLVGLDFQANSAVLMALLSTNHQVFSQEDVRVSPLHYRGGAFFGGWDDLQGTKLFENLDIRKVPDLFLVQKSSAYPKDTTNLLAQKTDVTVYQLDEICASQVALTPYLISKFKAFCQSAFKKK